jgi:opacity protein-like surface antigen
MKIFAVLSFLTLGQLFAFSASAVTTEVGINYNRKKSSFDANNLTNSEYTTGSLSFYFSDRVAIELSYTKALAIREEKIVSGSTVLSQQTIVQTTQALGSDLIWVVLGRRTYFQPFLKAGAAQLKRVQEVKDHLNNTVLSLEPETAIVPSLGAGFKIAITEQLSVKISYDTSRTPVSSNTFVNDDQLRAGLAWMF